MLEAHRLIGVLEKFLNGNMEEKTFLDKIESIENKLLDLEEDNKDNNKKRELIIQLLDSIDNIHMLLDEAETIPDKELELEIMKLKKLQLTSGNDQNKQSDAKQKPDKTEEVKLSPASFPLSSPGTVIPVFSSGQDIKREFESINKEQLMVAQGKFDFHPDMKSRMPLEKKDEPGDIDNIELKLSPLYNLLNSEKQYLSGNAGPMEFSRELENITNEIMIIKQETDENDSKEKNESD